jgi:hypothetical protein
MNLSTQALDAIEARIRDAERRIGDEVSAIIFQSTPGDSVVPMPSEPRWRAALRRVWWRWYGVREWIARKVLRVDIPEETNEW